MGKKGYWAMIFLTLIVNVVMLQWTIESYYGEEYNRVWLFSGISFIATVSCFITYVFWRRIEYK
ncbi:hypothetical protein WAK64_14375 [Bacillus spongiae]|uniref:Uncharacterized protein n=1 Tax=Bacillus spongiae TaxID=2683610 RepID=A0ABU8HFV1_9BACI